MDSKIIIILVAVVLICCSSIGIGAYFFMNSGTSGTSDDKKEVSTGTPIAEIISAPTPVKISGCENQPINFPCDVESGNIKYGRWDNTICPHGTVNGNTEAKSKTYEIPSGTKSIDAFNVFFKEDPYPNVFKHYTGEYTCKK